MNAHDDIASRLHPLVREATRNAGTMAASFFRSGLTTSARVWSKSGGSPVTEADMAVDAFLKAELSRAAPEAGWLSEETADDPARLGCDLVWIVDPIDGTRAFSAGIHDWSVSVALLAGGRPLLGVVYAPAHEAFFEARRGQGAFLNGEAISTSRPDGLAEASVTGPKSLVDRLEQGAGTVKRAPRIPSLALRLARVAEGALDAGLVSSDSHDWDLAAADLILEEAGGVLTGLDGAAPAYNQPEPVHGELLAASRRLHPRLIEAMTTPQASGESASRRSSGRTSP